MGELKKTKKFGFLQDNSKDSTNKQIKIENTGRLISWSPWPTAKFKTRYPAFPLVTTVLILIISRWVKIAKQLTWRCKTEKVQIEGFSQ